MKERTAKDEADYVKSLRREEPIKTEVIAELRQENERLLANLATVMEALIRAEDALRVYRTQFLDHLQRARQSTSHCTPGCTVHIWHDKDGWHRPGEN